MKKLILTVSLVVASLSAFGQGVLTFQNNAATRITNGVTGVSSANGAAGTQVGLYVGAVGSPASSLTLATVTTLVAPGTFNAGNVTINGFGAGDVALQVRAWLAGTVYASYEAAIAGQLGGDNSVLAAQTTVFTHTLVTGVVQPNNLNANPGFLANSGIRLVPVPEPSSIALGLLGLGAVALFRRRK
jgi:hypothetical protein